MSSLPYYKSLDGIRAIAVLMVVLIHSRLMPFGWIGVQIFFVLSGFLITGILLSQTNKPISVFMGRFYWRRGLRIWPLYFLFLATCAIAYLFVHIPENWLTAWPWLVTFTYNFGRVSPDFVNSDYFGHFWTLCVEEQFYLLWPFAVFFLPLKHFRKFVVLVVLAGPVIRFLTGLWFTSRFSDPTNVQMAVHNLPTSHLDAFASGALLAVLPAPWRARLAPRATLLFFFVLAVTIASGLLKSWFAARNGLNPHWLAFGYDGLDQMHQYVWAYSLLNLTSVCLILCALEPTALSRFLSFRPLVFIGAISYGVYLWHLPLIHIFSVHWPAAPHSASGIMRFAATLATILAVATLSYYCFERYFLSLKKLSLATLTKPVPVPTIPESRPTDSE